MNRTGYHHLVWFSRRFGGQPLPSFHGLRVSLSVSDDGIGGADPGGSGLIGLKDRVEALGGHTDIASGEVGHGSTLTAEIPCASA